MRKANERRLVVILFVLVMTTFSVAQQQSSKLDILYQGLKATASQFYSPLAVLAPANTAPAN
jgi:hypothetical protein